MSTGRGARNKTRTAMKGALGNLLQPAHQMQAKMQAMQDETAKLEVIGEAGGGMVKVTLNGKPIALPMGALQ